jgi:hypothetical protein
VDEQAKTVAPEELTPVEISFYDHEYYNGDKLVAAITHDDDHLTQRWVVMVNGTEIHRANTWAKCHNFITWHHKDGSLAVQEQNATETIPCTTGNEIIAQVAVECEKFELDMMEDGIYRNDQQLGEVGFSNGNWWFVRSGESQERVPCDSALDAVWWLSNQFAITSSQFAVKTIANLCRALAQPLVEKSRYCVSEAVASPRSLLASRRERHCELRIGLMNTCNTVHWSR